MPQSGFFIRERGEAFSAKRKRVVRKSAGKQTSKHKKDEKFKAMQENISSDEYSEQDHGNSEAYSSEEETEQEKKLRLAEKYLAQLKEEEQERNLLDDTKEAVSQRLKDEVLEEAGRLQKKLADEFQDLTPDVHIIKGHQKSVTCIVVSSSEKFFFSASKDCSIIKWSLEEKTKLKTIAAGKNGSKQAHGHTDHILALALSSDDKFLASGCNNKIINIWNADTLEHIKTFTGHKNAITGLVFARGSHQLISASSDRSLKLWNLDEMGYVETLFGHQDAITGLDCFLGETAITSGGRDNSIRIWKIVEESQLVFQGHGPSMDCVCVSSYQSFVSGGDDGSLLLWGTQKKKPMYKVSEAHGSDPDTEEANWIVSVCSIYNTDLVASGSKDGFIRLWKRDDDTHSLILVSKLSVCGFVNALQFTPSGKYLIAGIGKEHRLGRWWRMKESKNSIAIFTWEKKS